MALEFARSDLDAGALAERLAMTGTEVDRVLHHGVCATERFVVGRVLEAEPHPDADRLSVCRVDVGEAEPAQIVCGAPNVAAGQTVAVARPGRSCRTASKLRRAKIRGVVSEGMILAEDELGIGTEHAGIMVLPDGPAPGTPLAEVLPLGTDVLELEITPNRPDCLGLYGVAREVHAATGAPLANAPSEVDPGTDGPVPGVEISVAVPDLCPRFTARLYENVTIAPSPPWLKARLMAAGQRPISNVVDITNYVMLVTGQPLHAFDWDRVAGGRLEVRAAEEGEAIETLDGQVRRLDPDVVLIADAEGPTSIAGVMGGARSEVNEITTRVLMEAATWNGPNIHRTSAKLGLRSEASGRYEKGLQPEQAMEAQAMTARMMEVICGVKPTGGTVDIGGPGPTPRTIRLRAARLAGLLGVGIAPARVEEILTALGFGVQAVEGEGWDVGAVLAPRRRHARGRPHRGGLAAREPRAASRHVAPAHGRVGPPDRPAGPPAPGGGRPRRARAARGRGLELHRAGPRRSARPGRGRPAPDGHPRSQPHERRRLRCSAPRSSGSLLDVAARSVARGAGDLRLFEQGAVYLAQAGAKLPRERNHLAGLLAGSIRPPGWREPAPPRADFFAAKGILEALLATLRAEAAFAPAEEPFLHPGRSARVGDIGWLGEVHPLVLERWELPPLVAWEIDLDALSPPEPPQFRSLSEQPAVRQDLAVVVPAGVAAADVLAAVREAAETLESADVFDVYSGVQVGEGRVSLALHLTFRRADRTLTEEEASAERGRIVARLTEEFGAEVRA